MKVKNGLNPDPVVDSQQIVMKQNKMQLFLHMCDFAHNDHKYLLDGVFMT